MAVEETPVSTPATPGATDAMESPPCPSCGGERRHIVLVAEDRLDPSSRTQYSVVRCEDCGLAFTDPRPTPQAIGRFYPESYGGLTTGGVLARLEQAYRGRQQREVRGWLADLRPERGRLLDAGCGSGDLLAALREDGWDTLGVEPSPVAARLARERHDLDVMTGRFEEAELPPVAFDVVTLTSVLEHLHDPLLALRRARELLRPGGLVAVLFVPRFDSREAARFGPRWLALDLPRHLTHFGDATFRALAARAGLRVEHQEDYSRRHNAAQAVGSLVPSLQKHRFYQRETERPDGLAARLAPAARRAAFLAATAAVRPVVRRRALRGDTGLTSYFLVPLQSEDGS